jgi:hypothetical protein
LPIRLTEGHYCASSNGRDWFSKIYIVTKYLMIIFEDKNGIDRDILIQYILYFQY